MAEDITNILSKNKDFYKEVLAIQENLHKHLYIKNTKKKQIEFTLKNRGRLISEVNLDYLANIISIECIDLINLGNLFPKLHEFSNVQHLVKNQLR